MCEFISVSQRCARISPHPALLPTVFHTEATYFHPWDPGWTPLGITATVLRHEACELRHVLCLMADMFIVCYLMSVFHFRVGLLPKDKEVGEKMGFGIRKCTTYSVITIIST